MFKLEDLPTLHRMQDAARRIAGMVHARACHEYGLAFGVDDCKQLDFCIIHNSIVGYASGRPWGDVNYDHMRRAAYLLRRQHEASRIVNNWYRRKCGLPAD